MAIMAGVGTVLADNPLLTCRIEGKKSPIRIICDTHLRMPPNAEIVKTAKEVPTIIAVSESVSEEKKIPFVEKGCEIWELPEKEDVVDLHALMQKLGERKIDSVLLEGGGTLNFTALRNGIVNAVQAYIAPKIFGGTEAKTPVEGMGVCLPEEAFKLKNTKLSFLGEDILIESELIESEEAGCGKRE